MMKKTKKICFLFIVILGSLGGATFIQSDGDIGGSFFDIRNKAFGYLVNELVYEKPVAGTPGKTFENRTIIYVLGGGQDALNARFRIASILYQKSLSKKILILARPGTTEFDSDLGRNLTNDEWSIRVLERFNVRKEDIEAVPIRLGLFGTANEASNLPRIVQGKGFDRLILVTSSYHTKRTYSAFSRFAADRRVELFIYGSGDDPGPGVLLKEYIKLLLYEKIVFPVYGKIAQAKFGASR